MNEYIALADASGKGDKGLLCLGLILLVLAWLVFRSRS